MLNVTIGNSVTNIGYGAFIQFTSLTAIVVDALNPVYSSVAGVLFNQSQTTLIQFPEAKAGSYAIPNSVTSIGSGAFSGCTSLTAIMVDALNPVYSSVDGVLFNQSQATLIQFPAGKAGSYTIPNSVTSIGYYAFYFCARLTSVTIPTSIGDSEFSGCTSLTGVYFQGNAPGLGSFVFERDDNATVHYLPGTTGWGPTFGGRPTVLRNPKQLTGMAMSTGVFRFVLNGPVGSNYVIQVSSNLVNWLPLSTHLIPPSGAIPIIDPTMANQPRRFYRAVPNLSADIIIPAASVTVTPPFINTNGYIYQPAQTTVPANGGRATYDFTITSAGSYVIRAMVNARHEGANSVFVNIDAEPQGDFMVSDILPFTSGFEQRTLSWRGNGTFETNEFVPKFFNLEPGLHRLIIRGREGSTFLQSLTISPSP